MIITVLAVSLLQEYRLLFGINETIVRPEFVM